MIVAVAIVVIGLITYLRNPKESVNRSFLLLSALAAIWQLLNYFGSAASRITVARPLMYADFAVGAMLVWSFWYFSYQYYLKIRKKTAKNWVILSLLLLSIGFALFSSYGLVAAPIFQDNTLVLLNEVFYWPYVITVLSLMLLGIASLFAARRRAKSVARVQLTTILAGLFITSMLLSIPNLVLPNLVTNQELLDTAFNIGHIGLIVFLATTSYAIIKHRMFDIRFVIARSVAYVMLVLTMGLIYGFIVFYFVDNFFPNTQISTLQQALYTFLAVFLAFTFQPIKRFFDRITDRVFYRDRYDTEDVLNRLGKVFVAKSNSFELLDESLKIIVDTLKAESGRLMVLDQKGLYRISHMGDRKDVEVDVQSLMNLSGQISISDELNDEEEEQILKQAGAYALVKLKTRESLVGYLLLGAKRSGVIYTQQDINFLRILSQELAVAIENAKSYEEIQAFSETLKKEVDEATAKLRDTNKRLVKLDEAKDEFISMASHQLRTPLTTIKGYLSMLLDGDAGKLAKKQKDFIDMAFVSSQRMVHLISDMLNVSRISTGRLTIDKTKFDLVAVTESELSQLHRQIEAHEVKLEFEKPDAPVEVELDENKIRQVIMNFTDNAMYYSPKGNVEVSVKEEAGAVEFRVEDNGIGVSEEAKKQLFTKFFRAENAQAVRPDGTGLGLYMAKQVIEAQGGEIIFSSEKGKGSIFGFRFRLEDKQKNREDDHTK